VSDPPPTLVVYKEIVAGDLLKLQAASNTSLSGGGARDLRLPWKTFRPAMNRIFTGQASGRGGVSIRVADFVYIDASGRRGTTRLEYWPPTESRKTEDRIATIHKSPALGGKLPDTGRGRVFVLLIRFADGVNRCEYAYEDDLRGNVWAAELSSAIRACINATDIKNSGRSSSLLPVQGIYDFTDGTHFCHAD
jgi:hypothetical protein